VSQPDQPRPVRGPSAPLPSAPLSSVPGPSSLRPAAVPGPSAVPPSAPRPGAVPGPSASGPSPFVGLAERPVSEHVAVFEAEHDRLQRELATIDQL